LEQADPVGTADFRLTEGNGNDVKIVRMADYLMSSKYGKIAGYSDERVETVK
jgi:hypothetical protein